MATIPKNAISVASVSHGEATPVREFPEAAAQTFTLGALLIINASGQVEEAAADPSRVDGIALGDASGTTNQAVSMVPTLPAVIFEANIGGAGTSDQSDVGDQRGMVKESNNWHVDEAETANVLVEILGLRSDAGDTNGRVYFRFLTTASVPLLDASGVANVANIAVEGGIPVVFRILATALTGNIDVTMKHKVRVIEATARQFGGAGGAADTITVSNGANAITDAMDLNIADNVIARAATIDDAQHEIAAGGTLRIAGASAVNAIVYVTALRVA